MLNKIILSAIVCFLGLSLFLFFSIPVSARDYDYININNPFLKKTPIAVTEFKAFNGHVAEVAAGKKARNLLRQALDFTGYLKTMNPVAFLSNPAESGIQLGQINFRDWTGIGAELLITGGIEEVNGKVKLKLRLFDTF
ncbi:MAG: Tol-Pal system beta propeller repeat protein TolB, partial [Desulfobacula sp.]|nr:Tol-Pal system beta propeller repeat protein TolB [Desulfobacula sp.]